MVAGPRQPGGGCLSVNHSTHTHTRDAVSVRRTETGRATAGTAATAAAPAATIAALSASAADSAASSPRSSAASSASAPPYSLFSLLRALSSKHSLNTPIDIMGQIVSIMLFDVLCCFLWCLLWCIRLMHVCKTRARQGTPQGHPQARCTRAELKCCWEHSEEQVLAALHLPASACPRAAQMLCAVPWRFAARNSLAVDADVALRR